MRKINEILLVDDDPITNFLNNRILQLANVAKKITIKTNQSEAIDYLKETKVSPELILLDDRNPVMNESDFLEIIKHLHLIQHQDAIIVLMTIYLKESEIYKFKQLGVHEFISKPLSEKKLSEVFNKYFSKTPDKQIVN